jgi:AraC family transcriptional regulator
VSPRYRLKLDAVLNYIDNNLSQTINVSDLSELACFSKFHFHRLFFAHVGVSVGLYVRLVRFKQASYQLAFRTHISLTDIAFDTGFASAASFSREFKKIFGITPSSFRKQPDWQYWHQIFDPMYTPINTYLTQQRDNDMQQSQHFNAVRLVDFAQTRVAVKEHIGSPSKVMSSVASFIEWRKSYGVLPSKSATYNIFYDDPSLVESDKYRLDICAATDIDIPENKQGVIAKVIPAGRCAVYRHLGSDSLLGQSIQFLYAQWLPTSSETLRDFPCFIHRVNLFPDVTEQQSIIDIYLPIE